MSRRDTIIIALLVNAGLLALLFMLAVNTDDDSIVDSPEITKTIVDTRPQIPVNKNPAPVAFVKKNTVNDEVDNFLKDLASEDAAHSIFDDEAYIELKPEVSVAVAKPAVYRDSLPNDGSYVEVTVKRGDALEKIARSNGTTVEAIKKTNNLTTAKLSIGQTLRIPLSSQVEAVVAPPKPVAAPKVTAPQPVAAAPILKAPEPKPFAISDVQYYTIKSGDNPWKIAKQFNVKFDDLLKLNNLDEERARNLKIGDKVRVK